MAKRSSRLIDFQLSSHGRSTPHPQCIHGGGSFLIGPSATLTQMRTQIYALFMSSLKYWPKLMPSDASSWVGSLFTVGVLTVRMMKGCFGIMQVCNEAFCFIYFFGFLFRTQLPLPLSDAFIIPASFGRFLF